MTVHTCQGCGRERDAAALDIIDTPRGSMIVCRHADTTGDCIVPTIYRVVMRYDDATPAGVTVFDAVRMAATEREAVEYAAKIIGNTVRVAVDDYRTELRRVLWARAEGMTGGEWLPVSGELRAVTS